MRQRRSFPCANGQDRDALWPELAMTFRGRREGVSRPVTECFMQRRARPALPSTITVFAAAVSAFMLLPSISPAAAETCLTAPNAPAPQGSHWYYRIERPSLR